MGVGRPVTREVLKALFHELVKRCGGAEAVGVKLGVTMQRVSQLYSPNCADIPSVIHIAELEDWLGEPVVSAFLANSVRNSHAAVVGDLPSAARQATYAASELLRLAHAPGAPNEELRMAAITLQTKADAVVSIVSVEPPA